MGYLSVNCPQCGVKSNLQQSSIDTMRRCPNCGHKFIVKAAPFSLGGCMAGILAFLGIGAVAIAGCCGLVGLIGSSSSDTPPHDAEQSPSGPRTQTSTQINPAPAFDGNVALTLNVTEMPDKRVKLDGTTNLPSGTKLMLSVQEKMENGFLGQSSCSVSSAGDFESEAFGPPGGLKDGRYVAEVTMPVAAVQPVAVKKVIGNDGENLTGPLVENGSFGVTVSQQKEFTIGVMADAAQAKRKQQAEADTAALKRQLCVYLQQLLQFKDEPQFKEYGFGTGGPYNKWLKDVEALADAQPTGNHSIPLVLRAAPGELITLGMEYIKGESNYTRQMLPEIKEAIDFDAYLAETARAINDDMGPARVTSERAFHKWTSGKFSTEAQFLSMTAGMVKLRKRDGAVIEIPLDKLSESDQEYIRSAAYKRGE